MAKNIFEFQCTNCPDIFDIKLNTSLNGNYRVHCPGCGHIHYRVLENGEITQTRFPDNPESILIEDIRPMKSSCRRISKETPENTTVAAGFLKDLWARTAV